METLKITNSDLKISENFSFKEYFNTAVSHTNKEFDIPRCLVDGIQHLRDYWKEPLNITSAYRPGDSFGFHKIGHAVDTVTTDFSTRLQRIADFKEECLNYKNSPLIKALRCRGVNGFGIESYTIHFDYRPDQNCHLVDNYGRFCIFFWENDGTANGKSTLVK